MLRLSLIKKTFQSETLGISLTIYKDQNEKILFVGNEVANMLGYRNPRAAIIQHVDDEDVISIQGCHETRHPLHGRNIQPHTKLITEPGLYSLVLSSKLDFAKSFKRWVTKEVLPNIRKSGYYARPGVLEVIKSIELDDIRELARTDEEKRIVFRKESKYRSDLAKDEEQSVRRKKDRKQDVKEF